MKQSCWGRVAVAQKLLFGVALATLFGLTNPGKASEPSLYLQTGLAQSVAATSIHRSLAENWMKYRDTPHLDRAGFFQIYLDVMNERPWFPYFAGVLGASELRFVNYGHAGFFVGRASPSSSSSNESKSGWKPFENLVWGASYLSPEVLSEPGFLRNHFIRTHGLSQARRSFSKLKIRLRPLSDDQIRQGYVLVWSGGVHCLARLNQAKGTAQAPQQGLGCDFDAGAKLSELDDLSQDEQFFYFLSGRPAQESRKVCKAVGIVDEQGIEGFGVTSGTKARCVLYRSAYEDSWGVRSKVHCLLPVQQKHLWSNFDHVDFVFPTSQLEQFVLVESRFDPPRLTHVNLDKGVYRDVRSDSRGLDFRSSGGKSRFNGLPRGDYGAYQCMVRKRGKALRQLFFVPKEVYLGKREVNLNQDRVHGFHPSASGVISSEALSWREVMTTYPSLDRFPELGCVYELSVDAKCGIKALQTAAQIVWEEQSGALAKVTTKGVRLATLGVTHNLLERLNSALPQWGLSQEVGLLGRYLEKRLGGSAAKGQSWPDPKNHKLNNPWKRYLRVTQGFWASVATSSRE